MNALLGNFFGAIFKFVYNFISNIGAEPKNISFYAITIIIMTILFRLITLPLNLSQTKQSKKMNDLQPELKKIQEKYKSDPETQNRKMMELYQKHNYNPMSGCLPLLIQFPILIAFYNVIREPIKYVFKNPEAYAAIQKNFLWLSDLEVPDPIIWGLPLLAALTTFLQSKVMMGNMPSDPKMQSSQNMMNIFMPIMIFMMSRSFPSGLALYWVVGNVFQIIQTLLTNKRLDKNKEEMV